MGMSNGKGLLWPTFDYVQNDSPIVFQVTVNDLGIILLHNGLNSGWQCSFPVSSIVSLVQSLRLNTGIRPSLDDMHRYSIAAMEPETPGFSLRR